MPPVRLCSNPAAQDPGGVLDSTAPHDSQCRPRRQAITRHNAMNQAKAVRTSDAAERVEVSDIPAKITFVSGVEARAGETTMVVEE